jgi:peroxiredoxin
MLRFVFSFLLTISIAHAAPQIGDRAPVLVLNQADGRIFKLDHIRTPIVVVDFYATWCEPCQLGIKALGAALAPFRDRAQLIIVDVGEDPAKAAQFLASHPLPRRAIVVYDPFASVAKIWGQTKFPTTFILDQSHVIRKINRGYGPGYGARISAWLRAIGLESAREEKR